mmetsp:Transcript_23465/g.50861  ORF Transcript_23465/g.50861 Transcript_23465/m.50861 type:complete len:311 (+) Transcript_23465:531-1463(+)
MFNVHVQPHFVPSGGPCVVFLPRLIVSLDAMRLQRKGNFLIVPAVYTRSHVDMMTGKQLGTGKEQPHGGGDLANVEALYYPLHTPLTGVNSPVDGKVLRFSKCIAHKHEPILLVFHIPSHGTVDVVHCLNHTFYRLVFFDSSTKEYNRATRSVFVGRDLPKAPLHKLFGIWIEIIKQNIPTGNFTSKYLTLLLKVIYQALSCSFGIVLIVLKKVKFFLVYIIWVGTERLVEGRLLFDFVQLLFHLPSFLIQHCRIFTSMLCFIKSHELKGCLFLFIQRQFGQFFNNNLLQLVCLGVGLILGKSVQSNFGG